MVSLFVMGWGLVLLKNSSAAVAAPPPPQPAPGPGPGAHVRLDPRRLLSGTSTPVAMHFHKKGGNLIYSKEDPGDGFAHFLGVFLRKCTLEK